MEEEESESSDDLDFDGVLSEFESQLTLNNIKKFKNKSNKLIKSNRSIKLFFIINCPYNLESIKFKIMRFTAYHIQLLYH